MKKKYKKISDSFTSSLALEMLKDCEIMARYAISNGLKIPEQIGHRLMEIQGEIQKPFYRWTELRSKRVLSEGEEEEKARLEEEIGEKILADIQGLTRIHGNLSDIVAPATPRSIEVTEPAVGIKGKIFKIPLIKRMVIWSLILLFGYIISKYFPVNFNVVLFSQKFFTSVWCLNMLFQLHVLCAAGLGACFYALFTANRYLVARTYDPKYSQIYWTRFWLGILAGFILTNIIDMNIGGTAFKMTPTIIALLGGFSSDVVYRILRRLVEMLATFVRGETRDIIAAREREVEVKFKEKEAQMRLTAAASLSEIYEEARTKLRKESAERLKDVLDSLIEGIT